MFAIVVKGEMAFGKLAFLSHLRKQEPVDGTDMRSENMEMLFAYNKRKPF